MNPDFVDLLRAFIAADVRFLIVGAYALALHGRPRATGDLDVWVEASPENAPRTLQALGAFGAPLADLSESSSAILVVVKLLASIALVVSLFGCTTKGSSIAPSG